ncbi:adenylate guanylate cyclase [Leptolyngbya sp. Heron Island J]|uniref:AAA-like domain-containing protein n=1 Tax=Leptolyngbya sp. Heron Island J TaxID=1385935 RepID=UPI0003B9E9D3|nr:AAA-like domain-containing protein [Leptolyngbya sp. Heron Island J]ESA32862.1 adenylate guanylate cyclase [Leptolyngbya sp. Heron Island J]
MDNGNAVKRILILAANPKATTQLRLDEEVREIDEALRIAKNRDCFNLEQKWAVRPRDMQRALLDFEPNIVHFSGHGTGEDGLVMEDATGQTKLVSTEALASLFELYAGAVDCVLLNACYSEVQATAIAEHVPYVIGMNKAIGDKAALEFAIGFYDALGSGCSIERAFKLARVSILMAGIPEDLTPVLKCKSDLVESRPPSNASPAPKEHLSNISVSESIEKLTTPNVSSPVIALDEPEGQVPLDSAFYIERPPIEERCYETIIKRGALIRIKAPRQMGKSSLMLRILNHTVEQGCRVVLLNLQASGGKVLSSLDSFLYWFCARITRKLNLPNKLDEYWQSPMGGNDKCTDYFEYYLLEAISSPLVLCLDEVDELFLHREIASDFFGLLRAWHEESKINPIWQNLRIVITHSKEVYIPLNSNQSPFNVGIPIDLPPLTHTQVADLIQRHGLEWSDAEVDQLMELMGGHPYLVRVALYHIARKDMTMAKLIEIGPTEEWAYSEHLRRHLHNLGENEALLQAFKEVIVTQDKPVSISATDAFKLSSMGLVRFQGNNVIPLCDLYCRYFKDRLEVS